MVARWTPVAGWMEFANLDIHDGLMRAYTIAYRLKDDGAERWTERFNRFKYKDEAAIWAAMELFYGAIPPLLTSLGLQPNTCVFIPALSSGDTKADPGKPLPRVAKWVAKEIGVPCVMDALTKNAHAKLHTLGSADARDAALAQAEYQAVRLDQRNVFVIDDFITRGATLSKIAQAVLATTPNARVYGVALGKAESLRYCLNPQNDQVPERWDKLWLKGEAEYAEHAKKGQA